MATTTVFKNVVYSIPNLPGEDGWATTLSTYLLALSSGAAVNSIAKQSVRVATSSPVIVSATTDFCVVTDLSVAGAVAVTLPSGIAGQIFVVVEGKGDAATNNVTIQGTGGQQINGSSSYVLRADRTGVLLQFDGTQWRILCTFCGSDPVFSSITVTTLTVSGTATVGTLAATNATVAGAAVTTASNTQALTGKTIDADLNTITNIDNADIKAGAGIALNKLAATTAGRALVSDGSGFVTVSAATATEVGYLAGATGNIQGQIDSIASGGTPPGVIVSYAGASAPLGWLLCFGQEISRATYSALFTAIGTTYGVGDGSTTFNLPDLRGRVLAGKDDMGGTGAGRLTSGVSPGGTVLGAAGGSQTHALSTPELAAHTHTQQGSFASGNQSADHSHNFTSGGMSANHTHAIGDAAAAGHTHTVSGGARVNISFPPAPTTRLVGMARVPGPTWGGTTSLGFTPAQASAPGAAPGSDNQYAELFANTNGPSSNAGNSGTVSSDHSHSGTTGGMSASHTHTTTISGATTSTGSGSAHNNVQPTLILNHIIKV
jgi:microcystin-dependent protein